MNYPCVGFLELSTIAKGVEVADALLKKASVEVIFARPVSAGKYLLCFTGEVEDVKSAWSAGKEKAGASLLDDFVIPNIHPVILSAIEQQSPPAQLDALGILEIVTCASCIKALDAALKNSLVKLVKLQLGRGIGGKAYFIIEGEIGDIETAMAAALRIIRQQGIIEKIIIPHATSDLLQIFDRS